MENHPIPQDVTGFQFKLIGNMTIKQFAYLATGVVLAWATYAAPITTLIKLPFALLFGFSGFGLAFIPIDGRPLDSMLLYFIKALFTPNQYVFEKGTGTTKMSAPIPTFQNIQTQQNIRPLQTTPPLEKQEKVIRENPKPVEQQPTLAQQVDEQLKNLAYEHMLAQFSQVQTENKRLEEELASLKQILILTRQPSPQPKTGQPLAETPPPQTAPEPIQPPPTQTTQSQAAKPMVKKVTAAPLAKVIGFSTPEVPNILMGIIKDARKNTLANILVEVKDKDGSPVRAFKTNGLGQFASATPLPNGVYTLEFEDPQEKQRFDALELTMNGEVIGPIEITSIDQREELRKSLFPNA